MQAEPKKVVMKFDDIHKQLEGIPYILPVLAEELHHFILKQQPAHCLELGFAHGVSSCYIAAAPDECGAGHLTTVDLFPAQEWQHPAIEELLDKTGLNHCVSIHRENTSYTWFLQKQIYTNSANNRCKPLYDFCFIDGAKNWTIDSAAFFLVDKPLRDEAWILFNDLQRTYQSKVEEGKRKSDGITPAHNGRGRTCNPTLKVFSIYLLCSTLIIRFFSCVTTGGPGHKNRNPAEERFRSNFLKYTKQLLLTGRRNTIKNTDRHLNRYSSCSSPLPFTIKEGAMYLLLYNNPTLI